MVSVKIDNVSIDIESGLEFIKDGGEEFNLGVMKLVNTSKRTTYPDYADIEITVNSKVYEACIQKDLSKRTSIGIYNHDITLAETVIKLSQYIHPDRKYSTIGGNQITYLDQLENLLDTLDLGVATVFTIHADTQTLLGATAIEKEYSGGDLLTTLTDMFRSVNAVPTLSLDNEIGHELFGALGNEITIGDIISETLTSDIADYGLAVHSKIKSGTYEGNLITGGTFYPGDGYGVTPRSKEDKYDDDDAQYFLDSGIRRNISAIIMNLSVSVDVVEAEVGYFVVSKEEWDDLETETDATTLYNGKFKNNTFYYVEGDNVIQNVGVKTKNSTATVTGDDAMESMIKSWIVQFSGYSLVDYNPQNISDMEIQWYYQPLRDFDVRLERHNIDRAYKNATVMNNQKDSTLELQRYGNALKSHINRIANDTFEVSIRYNELVPFTTWDLNDYTSDGYKIVKIKFMTRDNSLDVTYLFTKNQSILNPQTSVNRSVSPFTITKRNILSCFIYNDYIEFSGTDRTTTSLMTAGGLKVLMNALAFNASYDKPVYNAQYYSTDGGSVYINMSVMNIPMGQSLVFNAQFSEPRIAGYQLASDTYLGHKLVPVPYADSNGEVDECIIRWGNGNAMNADNHPVGTYDSSYMFNTGVVTIGLNPDEIFGITHHQHMITDRTNLIIGNYFTENNSMIKELAIAPSLTLVYFPTNPNHTIYDKVVKSGSTGAGGYSISAAYDEITITGVPSGYSWALVETASPFKLYMAYNNDGTDLNTIYINRLKARPNIEIL